MKISPENLSNELTRKLLSCYLISGDEPLLVQESHDLIRKKAYKEGFTTRETFDQTQTFDWQEIINSCSNMSLFSDKKIIEIRFASSKPGREAINSINELIARLNQDLMIIISMPKLDKASLSAK
ncbi:MAG: DNA polymerase III subunit delta, partial [Woeseiaceae bacterium]|nr:DNA polymerase III subunit delta [Woeseiaceae bacterium]